MPQKTFERDPFNGTFQVVEIDPLYGEVDRPAGRIETLGQRIKGFFQEHFYGVRALFVVDDRGPEQ